MNFQKLIQKAYVVYVVGTPEFNENNASGQLRHNVQYRTSVDTLVRTWNRQDSLCVERDDMKLP